MTWHITRIPLSGVAGQRIVITDSDAPLTVDAVVDSWSQDRRFAEILAASAFEAFYWEMPPLRAGDIGRSFECVVVDAPSLAEIPPDPAAFAERFEADQAGVVAFPNLSGDAILIVPRPLADLTAYGHLAAFVRRAPDDQVRRLFERLAITLRGLLDVAPRWVSTAGLGVPWLHLRIDRRPKYYRWQPYRAAPRTLPN